MNSEWIIWPGSVPLKMQRVTLRLLNELCNLHIIIVDDGSNLSIATIIYRIYC